MPFLYNWRRFWVCVGILFVLEMGTIVAFCGKMFQCGCTLTAGLTHCNIYTAEPHPCPWCSHGWPGFYLPFAIVVAGTALCIIWGLRQSQGGFWWGLSSGISGYLLWGNLAGLATAAYHRYPRMYGWDLEPVWSMLF